MHDEHPSVYNGCFEVEITIDRPVAVVWPQFLDARSWITSHDIELVTGSPNTIGSINKLTWRIAGELGMPGAHHHYCKIIKLIPERQYVLKTYAEDGGSYGMQITAFDDTRFFVVDGKTRVVFNIFVEIKADSVAKDPTVMNLDASRDGMLINLNNLKRILESQ